MDSRTKHDVWIMTVSTLATVVVATMQTCEIRAAKYFFSGFSFPFGYFLP